MKSCDRRGRSSKVTCALTSGIRPLPRTFLLCLLISVAGLVSVSVVFMASSPGPPRPRPLPGLVVSSDASVNKSEAVHSLEAIPGIQTSPETSQANGSSLEASAGIDASPGIETSPETGPELSTESNPDASGPGRPRASCRPSPRLHSSTTSPPQPPPPPSRSSPSQRHHHRLSRRSPSHSHHHQHNHDDNQQQHSQRCRLSVLWVKLSDLGLGLESEESIALRVCSGSCAHARSTYDVALRELARSHARVSPSVSRVSPSVSPVSRVSGRRAGRHGRRSPLPVGGDAERGYEGEQPCCRPAAFEAVSFQNAQHRWQVVTDLSAKRCRCR